MSPPTALLVIDMQVYFEPMTRTALPNIQKLISAFKSTSSTIIFTPNTATLTKNSFANPSPNQIVRKWGPENSIASGSDEWRIQKSMPTSTSTAIIVAKNTYDAFINTNLTEIMESKGIERVVVCGVMANCCCDTTARSAFNRGYETWLVGDACGSTSEESHRRALEGYDYGYGPVMTTQQVLELLD
ncbi:Isochorismatase-like protein [Poronia punctata]|nr:Isochorismatase-like protein [Poronia punctata]